MLPDGQACYNPLYLHTSQMGFWIQAWLLPQAWTLGLTYSSEKFPTNLIVSEVDLKGPVHRNLQKLPGNQRVSVATNISSTVTVKVGGRKAWSSTQSSGMSSKDKRAAKSTPRNKVSRQANLNSTRGGFPKKKSTYTRVAQVYLETWKSMARIFFF